MRTAEEIALEVSYSVDCDICLLECKCSNYEKCCDVWLAWINGEIEVE